MPTERPEVATKANEKEPKEPPFLDQLREGGMSVNGLAERLMRESYKGLHTHIEIPSAFRHCRLRGRVVDEGTLTSEKIRQLCEEHSPEIINPDEVQLQAMNFLLKLTRGDPRFCEGGDPLRPKVGAYLYGPPGKGKTHILSAFGMQMKALLKDDLTETMRTVKSRLDLAYARCNKAVDAQKGRSEEFTIGGAGAAGSKDVGLEYAELLRELKTTPVEKLRKQQGGGTTSVAELERAFTVEVEECRRYIASHRSQPTNVLFMTSGDYCALNSDPESHKEALRMIRRAPVVIIDDLNPLASQEQTSALSNLIQDRYNTGMFGTFISSNIPPGEFAGLDENLVASLRDRMDVGFLSFDFTESRNWRKTVLKRRVEEMQGAVAASTKDVPIVQGWGDEDRPS